MSTTFKSVNGSTYTGAYAANGSLNAVTVDGTAWTGRTHACGAVYIVSDLDNSGLQGSNHPCGALRVVVGSGLGSRTPSGAINAVIT